MFYVAATCTGALAGFVSIFKKVLTIIQIVVPILLILSVSISVGKLMMNPDDKGEKIKHSIKNSIIAAILIFLLPMILRLTLDAAGNASSFTACWNTDTSFSRGGGYVSPSGNGGNRKVVIPNGSDYEPGTAKPSPSSSPSGNTGGDNQHTNTGGGGSQHANISKRIWVGDSRTVQMYIYVNDSGWGSSVTNALASGKTDGKGDLWSCKGSMGYSWMVTQGISNIESSIGNGSAIIILMGVNDCANPGQARQYASYVNAKASVWSGKGAHTYFVSIMPTSGSYQSLNSSIQSFNSTMKSSLSSNVKYIDANSYLKSSGFRSEDGLHYDESTSKKIYQYIMNNL